MIIMQFQENTGVSLNIFFRLVKHLLLKLNQTQPTMIDRDRNVKVNRCWLRLI